jgi:hypothetical protein
MDMEILGLSSLSDKRNGLVFKGFASALTREKSERELAEVNERIGEFGLVLTHEEIRGIIEVQHKSLADNDRIEIGAGAALKITEKFAQSRFIARDDFAREVSDILDLFYYLKSEIRDTVSDDELIETMYVFYTDKCAGSFELLSGRETEYIIRYFNEERGDILILDDDDDYNAKPEDLSGEWKNKENT